MQIQICIKGVSNKENKIRRIIYEYEDRTYTVREFLAATVELTLERYLAQPEGDALYRILTDAEIGDLAQTGKIGFGRHYNEKKQNREEAAAQTLQAFEDGLIAVFIDGEQYEEPDTVLDLHENSEAAFIRLAFLAGRMW